MVSVNVNGQERTFDGDPSMPLMWYLRDELGLTGTKFGCGVALCGACTVHLNGEAIRSCSIPMSDVAGKNIVTIEGLDPKGEHPVQVAWRNLSVPQCGYCQAGQIMQAAALLAKTPAPTDEQIDADCSRASPAPACSFLPRSSRPSVRPWLTPPGPTRCRTAW
jgi:isoquinoline 1-oxidoreductase alpha subunit